MQRIKISDRDVTFPRATRTDKFGTKRVITSSPWEFVGLWLNTNASEKASIYWEQAKNFYTSAQGLPVQSAPLPLYYSFLNATKALLEAKSISYFPYHGVSGFDMRANASQRIKLENEGIAIKNGGVLPSLMRYFSETETTTKYCLTDILSNIAFIHRAFSINYSRSELFLSIKKPRYVTDKSGHAWFRANLPDEHTHGQTLRTIPAGFSTKKLDSGWIVESLSRFPWTALRRPTTADLNALSNFHSVIRRDISFISGSESYWYIKRDVTSYLRVNRNNLVLVLMAMHRMSEISRYKPIELSILLEGRRNWIIHEFVRAAQRQFIDEIACEITGLEISPAGVMQGHF